MNMLNSIILEGNVTRELDGNTFEIGVIRYSKKDNGDKAEEKSNFEIEIGCMLTDVLRKNIYKDRGIRVVGRLKQIRWTAEEDKPCSKVVVIAEHLEFKPHVKKLPTD